MAERRFEIITRLNLLQWHQFSGRARMSRLASPLALTLRSADGFGRLFRPITGGWLGGIAGVAIELLAQSSNFCFQRLHSDQ